MSELAAAIASAVVAASRGGYRLEAEINVGGQFGLNQYQCDLACDPTDADNISITAKQASAEQNHYLFSTLDGGLTWSALTQTNNSDPDVVYDGAGNAFWGMLARPSYTLGMRKSVDGGLVWSARVNTLNAADHPHLAVDRSGGSFDGSIYQAGVHLASGNVRVNRSRDGAATWQSVSLLYPAGSLSIRGGTVSKMAVAADDTLLIPITSDEQTLTSGGQYAGTLRDIYVLRGRNGGVDFDPEIFISHKNDPASQGMGGYKFSGNIAFSDYAGGQRAYLPWMQKQTSGVPAKLMLAMSEDLFTTFQIDEIPLTLPAGLGPGSFSIAVNKFGRVGIQFLAVNQLATVYDVYFIYSRDAGVTWSDPIRISSVSTSMTSSQPRSPGADQVMFDVDADGKFCCVWPDARAGGANYTIFMRKVSV